MPHDLSLEAVLSILISGGGLFSPPNHILSSFAASEIIVMRGTPTSHVHGATKFLSRISRPRSAYSSTNLAGISECPVRMVDQYWPPAVARIMWIIDSGIVNLNEL
jgi:hypothetical protein